MADVSSFLPPRAHCVVEFGCGRGETGAHFLRMAPSCRYVGIDTDREALREAEEVLSQTAIGSPAVFSFALHGITRPDVICVQGRAMDELSAPLLRELAGLLAPGGQLVLALRNASSFRNVLRLFAGRPQGGCQLTLSRLLSLLKDAGLSARVQVVQQKEDAALREDAGVRRAVADLVELCRARALPLEAEGWTAGWVVRAFKEPPSHPFFLYTVIGENIACDRVRIREPESFLSTCPEFSAYTVDGRQGIDLSLGEKYPQCILLRQRMLFGTVKNALGYVQQARSRGYLLGYELDDDPHHWEAQHVKAHYLDFRAAHFVQVSTEPLAAELRQYNPHVAVFRNELRELPSKRVLSPVDAPVTIFFGALNREQEWPELMPVLNAASKRYGEKLRFLVLADRKFYEALETPHKEFLADQRFMGRFVPYPIYQAALHRSDIALLPLHDTALNRKKSDLKFIESAGHGAVVLASPTVYADTVRDGRTGFLYHNLREFRQYLSLLIEDRSRRVETAAAAYRYVAEERLLSQHYEERIAFYQEALAHASEWDAELVARIEGERQA